MARPDYVPDYIPDEEVENYKFYYEYEIIPQLDAIEAKYDPNKIGSTTSTELPSEYDVITQRNIFDSAAAERNAAEAEAARASRGGGRDPFKSFVTPETAPELKRTEKRRMQDTGLEEAVLARNKAELANREVDLSTLSPEARRVFKSVQRPEMSEIEKVLYNAPIDPALEKSLERAQKDYMRTLNKEKAKLFDFLTIQNINAGQDIQTAQRNAQSQVIAIERAERVPSGFQAPPVRAGERKISQPLRGEYAPSVSEAFSRKTLVSEADIKAREEAGKMDQRQRSAMYAMFAQQAVGELKSEMGADWDALSPSERVPLTGRRAKQIEGNYVQGELLSNYLRMARVGYMDVKGIDATQLTRDDEKEIANLGGFLYYDFVNNVYPEYSGDEDAMRAAGIELDDDGNVKYRNPTFFEEVFTEETPTGAVKESRTAAALRGVGGLIRPVTEGLVDVSTFPVVEDPLTGEITYPEGEGNVFQSPLRISKDRYEMSYQRS